MPRRNSIAIFHVNSFFEERVHPSLSAGWYSLSRKMPFQDVLVRFKKGHIAPEHVGEQVNHVFPQIDDFSKGWRKTCIVNSGTKALFQQIKDLERAGIPVYLFANIDHLQRQVIEKECGALPGTRFLSCERKEAGEDLWGILLAEIRRKHPGIETDNILLYYNPELLRLWPERLGLGGIRRLSDPLQKFLDDQKEAEIGLVEERGRQGDFQVVPLDPAQKNINLLERYHPNLPPCPKLMTHDTAQSKNGTWRPAFRRHLTGGLFDALERACPTLPLHCSVEKDKKETPSQRPQFKLGIKV